MIRLKTLLEQTSNLKPSFTIVDNNLISIGLPTPTAEAIYTYKLQSLTPSKQYIDIEKIINIDPNTKSISFIHLYPNKPYTIKLGTMSWNSILNKYNTCKIGEAINLHEFQTNKDNTEIDRGSYESRVYYRLVRVK